MDGAAGVDPTLVATLIRIPFVVGAGVPDRRATGSNWSMMYFRAIIRALYTLIQDEQFEFHFPHLYKA